MNATPVLLPLLLVALAGLFLALRRWCDQCGGVWKSKALHRAVGLLFWPALSLLVWALLR